MGRLSVSIAIIKEETAAVAIIAGLLVTAFVGFAAIVVDVGYMYEMRRQLQSAADAAALAGMSEKIKNPTITEPEILEAAREYAVLNDLVDRSTTLEMLTAAPDTVVTDDYVKIGVRKTANLFFAPIFGRNSQVVRAQAQARRVYVTGGRGLLPWGVNTIRATEIEARLDDDITWSNLDDTNGDLTWEGSVPAPGTPGNTGHLVDLRITNGQDFPLDFPDTARVMVDDPADSVSDVWLSANSLTPGQTTTLYVQTTDGQAPRISNQPFNGNMNPLGGGLYSSVLTAPAITGPWDKYSIQIKAGSGQGETYENAAVLFVRNNNTPVANVTVGNGHWLTAGGGSVPVSVTMRDLEYGNVYDLKVISNPEAGNFNALDFRYVYHPPGYTANHGANDSAADYYDNLAGSYPGEIHIGDIITTKTGNLSGPTTTGALDTRIAGCALTFAQWEANGKPASCNRLIYVPIVERIERMTGQTDVIVTAIAVFYLERYEKIGNEKVNITGRFVEYERSGPYSSTPPNSGLYMETVRLDRPDY